MAGWLNGLQQPKREYPAFAVGSGIDLALNPVTGVPESLDIPFLCGTIGRSWRAGSDSSSLYW
jgi:hypothetical protein